MSNDKIKNGDHLTKSLDIVSDNISKLKELFPEVLTDGKIDFKVLQDILGNEIEDEEEYYRFTWAGKSQARREAHKPSTGTLRPCKEESEDWDTTQNVYIEGDNLEVLKLLQKSYSNKIKMIYIDPPYNTGKDFVYKDNYKDNLKNYQQITGQVDWEGNKLTTNSESDGRFHSNWLNMIYPRLKLARNLLKDDGIIFISIDDNEVDNLKKVCNEIFGEQNFVGNFIWRGGRRNAAKLISTSHEYMLCFAKNINFILDENINWKERKKGLEAIYKISQEFINKANKDYIHASNLLQTWYKNLKDEDSSKDNEHYKWIDKNGVYFASDISRGGGGGPKWEITNPETGQKVKTPQRGWAYSKLEDLNTDIENGLIHFNGDSVPCKKRYLKDNEDQLLETVFYKDRRGASKRLRALMNGDFFDFPKDEDVISEKIEVFTENEDIILDFFAGSSTTAHSVFKVNNKNNTKRKFILIQLPELTQDLSEAKIEGYKNICEIAKERIRRAGKKIKEENPLHSVILDTGFKVFKLDSSNIKGWDGDPDNIKNNLFEAQENIKPDRNEEDVLFEILLKYGLDLTLPIEQKDIEGKKVFNIGFGALFICFANNITSRVAEGIGKWKEELKPETCRVIFKDSGFNDKEKANSLLILKRFGIQEIKSI
jgi:adenine-specific DNA-methyltransferase